MEGHHAKSSVVSVSRHIVPLSPEATALLMNARSQPFSPPITAYISDISILNGICVGVVHNHIHADEHGRNADGTLMMTRRIEQVDKEGNFWVVGNGDDRYVITSFKEPDGQQSFDALRESLVL